MTDETTTEQLVDTSGRDIVRGLVLQVADLIQREEAEIERQPEAKPEPEPEKSITSDNVAGQALAGVWNQAKAERTIEELRSEVNYVQRLLGESRQRVTQLEELVGSLRTINDAQEKTVRLAGQENTDLEHRLKTVAAEWAEQAGTINGLQAQLDRRDAQIRDLQIELDALQQAPQEETVAATPPATEDRFEEGWDAGTARAVETIAEWTEPFRTCGSERLAWMVMQNLPHIMRTLTGLTPED